MLHIVGDRLLRPQSRPRDGLGECTTRALPTVRLGKSPSIRTPCALVGEESRLFALTHSKRPTDEHRPWGLREDNLEWAGDSSRVNESSLADRLCVAPGPGRDLLAIREQLATDFGEFPFDVLADREIGRMHLLVAGKSPYGLLVCGRCRNRITPPSPSSTGGRGGCGSLISAGRPSTISTGGPSSNPDGTTRQRRP